MTELCPKVGLGCLVVRDGRVLLGKRRGSHGEGLYATAGGHLEHMESICDGVRREIREETGLEIGEPRFLCVLNYRDAAPKHHVGVAFVADWVSGEPQLREPDKCEGWNWYDLEDLPEPLFGPAAQQIEALRTGRTFFD
ncbi:NUDIX hydrolase [Patescibacteria group bacterium]